MAKGTWSRWKERQSAEGYSLEIGNAYRASVIRYKTLTEHEWQASINTASCGTYSTKEAAMRAVEERIQWDMRAVLEDWEKFKKIPKAQIPAAAG